MKTGWKLLGTLKMVAISLMFGLFVWVADAVADYLFFYRGNTFVDLLFSSPPPHELYIRTVILVVFLAFGLMTSFRLERERKVSQKLEASLREREVLVREVHHRVKNNLAVILSLIRLQRSQNPLSVSLLDDLHSRINSIALIHKCLYKSETLSVLSLTEYLDELSAEAFALYAATQPSVRLEKSLTPVNTTVDLAVPCGLITNELIQNSCKHAFEEGERGTVAVALRETTDGFELEVSDDGKGAPASALESSSVSSLGLTLVHSLSAQIGATFEIDGDSGVRGILRVKAHDRHKQ